ncbi:DDB1- and CUL4-associated factor 8-like [Lolium rigidum]|uniref:DDB1- and CUL4-associated factor 8-like n=1 Tax=Lolium rigidum TaxID=89674 RepID=UPI001F5DECE3|nr:DDB1- and CUL4-associated factor 8-like [Lolium rigidum]
MPAEGTRMARLWEREVGRLPPKRFADAFMASEDFVHSLGIQKRLRNHKGAVNSISFNTSGSLLLSSSDDETAVLWNLEEPASALKFHTGHGNDVLDARFMPLSDDQSIITCGADAEVRRSRIQEGGCVSTDKLADLRYMVTQLAVQPGSHTFFSCVEDGSVWHFDLREKRPRKLFKCGAVRSFDYLSGDTMQLYAIALDPRYPSCFAVSGDDEYVRLYDARKIDLERSKFGIPFEQFCPPDLICNKRDGIAGLAFSQTGELLASYRHDNIYLFSREHGLHFNDFGGIAVEKLPVPRTFKGHENKHAIKGVSFLGPNCDYVTSGSDCGNIFIWRKKDGELIRVMKGDKRIVNCVKQHPTEIVVASCGIDADVKIWAPGDNENPSTARFDEEEQWFIQMVPYSCALIREIETRVVPGTVVYREQGTPTEAVVYREQWFIGSKEHPQKQIVVPGWVADERLGLVSLILLSPE